MSRDTYKALLISIDGINPPHNYNSKMVDITNNQLVMPKNKTHVESFIFKQVETESVFDASTEPWFLVVNEYKQDNFNAAQEIIEKNNKKVLPKVRRNIEKNQEVTELKNSLDSYQKKNKKLNSKVNKLEKELLNANEKLNKYKVVIDDNEIFRKETIDKEQQSKIEKQEFIDQLQALNNRLLNERAYSKKINEKFLEVKSVNITQSENYDEKLMQWNEEKTNLQGQLSKLKEEVGRLKDKNIELVEKDITYDLQIGVPDYLSDLEIDRLNSIELLSPNGVSLKRRYGLNVINLIDTNEIIINLKHPLQRYQHVYVYKPQLNISQLFILRKRLNEISEKIIEQKTLEDFKLIWE